MGHGRYVRAALVAGVIAFAAMAERGAIAFAQEAAPVVKAKKSRAAKAGPAAPGADAGAPVAKDPVAATRNYESGVAAYQAGKFTEAVQNLTAAIQGGVPGALMAKALYYRGAAFQKQKMPGQAISDLTSALWLKGGLTDTERTAAIGYRAAAYRDAGLDEAAAGPVPEASEQSASSVAPKPVTTGSTTVVPAPPAGIGGLFGNLFGASTAPKPAATPAAMAPAQVAAPATEGWLGDLFGGGSAPQPPVAAVAPAPAQVATGLTATGLAATGLAETGSVPHSGRIEPASGSDEPLPWANRPVTDGGGSDSAAVEPGAAPMAAAGPKTSAKGKYRIQVAAVTSRDEASAVIASLQSKGGVLAATVATVEESRFGGNTFYKVQLGPYARAADTKVLCETLKANGLDCLVMGK